MLNIFKIKHNTIKYKNKDNKIHIQRGEKRRKKHTLFCPTVLLEYATNLSKNSEKSEDTT